MRLLACAFAVLLAHPALAADDEGNFAIKGAGLQTCAGLEKAWEAKSPDLALYHGWIDGYLTGANQFFQDTFDASPWQTPSTWLGLTRELCLKEGGEARVMDVFNRLLRDFLPGRLAESSATTVLRDAGSAVVLYEETVVRMQKRLAEEGFAPGPADGIFDEATAKALADFQSAKGYEASGMPDQQTLFALFVRVKP